MNALESLRAAIKQIDLHLAEASKNEALPPGKIGWPTWASILDAQAEILRDAAARLENEMKTESGDTPDIQYRRPVHLARAILGLPLQTPLGKLEAALHRLEQLRDGEDWTRVRMGIRESGGSKRIVSPHLSDADGELIVTLHRTMDAQIRVLRTVIDAQKIEQNWATLVYTESAVALADAILGGDS